MAGERIQRIRNRIQSDGEALGKRRDEALIAGQREFRALDAAFLELLQDIITHDKSEQAHLTEQQRLGNLGNIVATVRLLDKAFQYSYYNDTNPDRANNNFWRDIAYLVTASLGTNKRNSVALHTITPTEAISILRELGEDYFARILGAEITFHQQAEGSRDQARETELRRKHRDYKNTMKEFPTLCSLVSLLRETNALQYAIDAAEHIGQISVDPSLNPDELLKNKRAILKQIGIIGEFMTKKNLSIHTVNFAANILKGKELRKIMIHLRNVVAHPEYDFRRGHLESGGAAFDQIDYVVLKDEIDFLKGVLEYLLSKLPNRADCFLHYNLERAEVPEDYPDDHDFLQLNALKEKLPKRGGGRMRPELLIPRLIREIEQLQETLQPGNIDGALGADDAFNKENQMFDIPLLKLVTPICDASPFEREEIVAMNRELEGFYRERPNLEIDRELYEKFQTKPTANGTEILNLLDIIKQNPQEFIARLREQVIRCRFASAIKPHKHLQQAAYFHIGKIGKYLQCLPRDIQEQLYDKVRGAEIIAFRNYIQHGNEMMDILNIENGFFLLRYARIVIRLAPTLRLLIPASPSSSTSSSPSGTPPVSPSSGRSPSTAALIGAGGGPLSSSPSVARSVSTPEGPATSGSVSPTHSPSGPEEGGADG